MLGIYELNIKKISFETGIDMEPLVKGFEAFARDGKAYYHESGYVILANFLKHQRMNTNMQISAINDFNELPEDVKNQPYIAPIYEELKAFDKGSEPLLKPFEPIAEIEDELESELEVEREREGSEAAEPPALTLTELQAREVAEYLLESIIDFDPTHRYANNPPSIDRWIKDLDLAIRKDDRTPEQLKFIIEYIYHHNGDNSSFWAGNIASGEKLRKHFDTIKHQILREQRNGRADIDQINRSADEGIEALEFEDAG